MKALPRQAIVREVGLRDGFRSIHTILSTVRKIEWIRVAYAAGQREIEVGSTGRNLTRLSLTWKRTTGCR